MTGAEILDIARAAGVTMDASHVKTNRSFSCRASHGPGCKRSGYRPVSSSLHEVLELVDLVGLVCEVLALLRRGFFLWPYRHQLLAPCRCPLPLPPKVPA
jgi:hypothetical protein